MHFECVFLFNWGCIQLQDQNKKFHVEMENKPKKKVNRYFQPNTDTKPDVDIKHNIKKKEKNFDVSKKKIHFEGHKSLKENSTLKNPFRPAKIPKKILKKYDKGPGVQESGLKTKFHQKLWAERNKSIELAVKQTARTEILNTEETGFITLENGEHTKDIRQSEIVANVDITAATKHFQLNLDQFGPYRAKYTNNGRYLLLAGQKGHIAAVDWVTKHLHCEINVMEELTDISWLHQETMFAVAQKSYVHVYDNKGTQLHCIKRMSKVNKLEFLPYHFLLVGGNEDGFLSWLDISIGELCATFNTKTGRIQEMCQNRSNGVIYTGDTRGIVSMWAPSVKEPLAYVSCHGTSITALACDYNGQEFITSSLDRSVKIWDIRKLGTALVTYKMKSAASEVSVSQRGLIAMGLANGCEVHRKHENGLLPPPYLRYPTDGKITGLQFCPYEDILGIATYKNFTSILVPGSGEANYDAFEANPFQSKSQRRENEVRRLLDKIPMDLIGLNPNKILEVNVPTFKEILEEKKKILFVRPPKIDFTPRHKRKSKNSSKSKRKQIIRTATIKEFKKTIEPLKKEIKKQSVTYLGTPKSNKKQGSVLDRFKPKSKL